MTRIDTAVQDVLPEGAYAERTVLDTGTLDSVRHANERFLDLVTRGHARTPDAAVLGLGPDNARRIAALAPAPREVASRCPYSLFNLRFEDAAFWRTVVRDARGPAPAPSCEEGTFARTAVFLAWHLAQSSDLAAAIVLGMTPEVQVAWRGLPLPSVDRAATLALPHLRARWGAHARFWPKLLDAAEDPSPEQAERVRLLGLQLLAADGIRPHLAQFARRTRRLVPSGQSACGERAASERSIAKC